MYFHLSRNQGVKKQRFCRGTLDIGENGDEFKALSLIEQHAAEYGPGQTGHHEH